MRGIFQRQGWDREISPGNKKRETDVQIQGRRPKEIKHLQTPAFYGPLETGLWGFVDSLNDSYSLVHAKLADVKQHLVGLNAAPFTFGVVFVIVFAAAIRGLDGVDSISL